MMDELKARVLRLLREIEWNAGEFEDPDTCPSCGFLKPSHDPVRCELADLIQELEKTP